MRRSGTVGLVEAVIRAAAVWVDVGKRPAELALGALSAQRIGDGWW